MSDSSRYRPKTYFQHPPEIRAKISRANRGRAPWNVGKKHSEETRNKISERNTQVAFARKMERAQEMNMTVEEFDTWRRRKNRETARLKRLENRALASANQRISSFSFASPHTLKNNTTSAGKRKPPNRAGKGHSEETRRLLSEKTKRIWQERYTNLTLQLLEANISFDDPDLRQSLLSNFSDLSSIQKKVTSPETRAKLSAIMKEKHRNRTLARALNISLELSPSFLTLRSNNETWRKLLSDKIKEKWSDPDYVTRVRRGIIDRHYTNKTISAKSRKNIIKRILQFYPNVTILALTGNQFWEREKQQLSDPNLRNSNNATAVEEALYLRFKEEYSSQALAMKQREEAALARKRRKTEKESASNEIDKEIRESASKALGVKSRRNRRLLQKIFDHQESLEEEQELQQEKENRKQQEIFNHALHSLTVNQKELKRPKRVQIDADEYYEDEYLEDDPEDLKLNQGSLANSEEGDDEEEVYLDEDEDNEERKMENTNLGQEVTDEEEEEDDSGEVEEDEEEVEIVRRKVVTKPSPFFVASEDDVDDKEASIDNYVDTYDDLERQFEE